MLEKLLKKSKSTRERYAFWGAVSTTGIIGLVWFLTLTVSLRDGGPFAVEESQQTASAFAQFFGELRDDFLERQPIQEEEKPAEEGDGESKAASSSDIEIERKATSSPAMVATTSVRSVQVGTSSVKNNR